MSATKTSGHTHTPFSYESAKGRAIANAIYFERPFMVFTDTCGNWRCESDNAQSLHGKEVVTPELARAAIAKATNL